MSMQKDRERLVNSRIEPVAHHFSADTVDKLKEIVAEPERMELTIYEGLDKKGYHVLHLVFNDAETGVECGELNDSHPCPPFDDCPGG